MDDALLTPEISSEFINKNNFRHDLNLSKNENSNRDIEILKRSIPGCTEVIRSSVKEDRANGYDYIVKLRRGAELKVDAKTREKGCSKFWKYNKPELALEIWSILPQDTNKGSVGWALDESKNIDFVLYTFDPEDCNESFLLPFHHLRIALRNNFNSWCRSFRIKKQHSYIGNKEWVSSCLFVPYDIVLNAITTLSIIE